MSKYDNPDAAVPGRSKQSRADLLRWLAKREAVELAEWHYSLVERLPDENAPHQVMAFFSKARLVDKTLFFNGATRNGCLSYDLARQRFAEAIAAAFGDVRLVLAQDHREIKAQQIFKRAPKSAPTEAAHGDRKA